MVAKIKGFRSILGVLNYNESKIEKSTAELIFAGGFPMSLESLNLKAERDVFAKLTRQNLRSKLNRLHISLNFSPKDKLGKDELIIIANDYMTGMGLGNQPYLVYQHFDAGHPHVHIATVSIENGGNRVSFKRFESFFVCKELANFYMLEKAEDHSKRHVRLDELVELKRVHYGKEETWKSISTVVNEVVKSYKYSSLPDFNAVLTQFGIRADAGRPGSIMHNGRGLLYRIVNEADQIVGMPIKASMLYGKPTLTKLEKRFGLNIEPRRPYGQRLRYVLDKALALGDRQEMEYALHKHGIRIVFNENPEGKVFGAHYIDNATRTVYSDLDLGEEYCASRVMAIIDKMTGPDQVQLYGDTRTSQRMMMGSEKQVLDPEWAAKVETYPGNELPVIQTLRHNLYCDYEGQEQQQQQRKLALEESISRNRNRGMRI